MEEMSLINIIKFKQPLIKISAQSGAVPLSEKDAYQKGYDVGQGDLEALKRGIVEKLGSSYDQVLKEISERLPGLVIKVAKKVLGEVTLDADQVAGIIKEVLENSAPEGECLEVSLSEEDYQLLHSSAHEIMRKYPKVVYLADAGLVSGDCLVLSRFGLVDATVKTKLEQVEEKIS